MIKNSTFISYSNYSTLIQSNIINEVNIEYSKFYSKGINNNCLHLSNGNNIKLNNIELKNEKFGQMD